jgi:hypothetical protein
VTASQEPLAELREPRQRLFLQPASAAAVNYSVLFEILISLLARAGGAEARDGAVRLKLVLAEDVRYAPRFHERRVPKGQALSGERLWFDPNSDSTGA